MDSDVLVGLPVAADSARQRDIAEAVARDREIPCAYRVYILVFIDDEIQAEGLRSPGASAVVRCTIVDLAFRFHAPECDLLGIVTVPVIDFSYGNIGNKLVSDISCDRSSFSEEQLAVLDKVYAAFKNDTPSSISQKSHDELAWKENINSHSLIDFKYAFYLKSI